MASKTVVRQGTSNARKTVSVNLNAPSADPGIGHRFASAGDLTIVLTAMRNQISKWRVVPATPENLKALAKKVAQRKAKKATLPPAFVADGYILYGGKARWDYKNYGITPESSYREYLRCLAVFQQLQLTFRAESALSIEELDQLAESMEDDE